MKRSLLMLGSIVLLSILLVACGDDDEVENPPQDTTGEENQQTEDNNTETNEETDTGTTDNTDTGTTGDGTANTETNYNFIKFDLEADYPDTNDALDVDFENEPNENMEASYRDQSQGIDLNGDEAMEELDNIFASFDFDETTANEEVLAAVIEGFNIPEEATNIELEIDFNNGTEKEYRR